MSDDQLEMLQRQLMQVQQQKTNPLSERTVAQILIKLHQMGFRFYSTTDNNQYITPTHIDDEIIKIVQDRGRLSLSILPQLLNLNQDLIESRVNNICNKKSTHVRHNGWLISQDYIQNILISFKQMLQVTGIVELDEEALNYQFDIKFIQKIVTDNIGMFDADLREHKIITHDYFKMKKRKVFGFLLAVTRPIEVSIITKYLTTKQQLKKNSLSVDVEAIVRQLIQQNLLKGKFQNLYYIPERFSKNQKAFIEQFFINNGYLQFTMLQKNYMLPKPEQWIKKNLNASQYIIFEGICFKKTKLQTYRTQMESLLKGQGFAQISNVIPFDLQQRKMNKFLAQNCELKHFFINQNICYSQQWIEKCVNQFRDRVIFDIFFSNQNKKDGNNKKKGGKKQKPATITSQQLVEALFDSGLAQYSVAEDMSDSLLPVLLDRLEQLKIKLKKQLTQSQGVISSTFLKYRRCKSIIRSQQNSVRVLNMIEKQKKKTGMWVDPDFGPTQSDPKGQYSLIYYDGILPKQWPEIDYLRWKNVTHQELIKTECHKSKILAKCLLTNVIQLLSHHNKISKNRIKTPIPQYLPQEAPYTFKFHVSQKQPRFVLIDNRMPYFCLPEKSQGDRQNQSEGQKGKKIEFVSKGIYGLVEKAYSKFRFCYKSLLSVSFNDLICELTGFAPIQKIDMTGLNLKQNNIITEIINTITDKGFKQQKLVILMAQGKQGSYKNIERVDGQSIQIQCLKPFSVSYSGQNLILYPGQTEVRTNQRFFETFANIWIIGDQENGVYIICEQLKLNKLIIITAKYILKIMATFQQNSNDSHTSIPKIQLKTHSNQYLDPTSKLLIQNIKKSLHIYEIRRQTEKLAQYWHKKYHLQQMIVDIKDNNYLTDLNRRTQESKQYVGIDQTAAVKHNKSINDYEIELYPKFKKYIWHMSTESKQISSILIWNLFYEHIKEAVSLQQWKFKKRQFLFRHLLTTHGSWKFTHELKLGKPIDQQWVSDCSMVMLSWSKLKQGDTQNIRNTYFWEFKGYQNKLKDSFQQQPRVYTKLNSLKYQDVFETGYCSRHYDAESSVQNSYYKFSLGTSLYSKCLYYKLKYQKSYTKPILDNLFQLNFQTKLAVMNGINIHLLPQQMLNRNDNKWMKQRSTAVLNLRANLYATRIKLLSNLNLQPYNYANVIVSDNFTKHNMSKNNEQPKKYGQHIKVQGELGIGIKLDKQLFIDIPLLRMRGQRGKPKFGIRYQF